MQDQKKNVHNGVIFRCKVRRKTMELANEFVMVNFGPHVCSKSAEELKQLQQGLHSAKSSQAHNESQHRNSFMIGDGPVIIFF
jgi:hypothetical protein